METLTGELVAGLLGRDWFLIAFGVLMLVNLGVTVWKLSADASKARADTERVRGEAANIAVDTSADAAAAAREVVGLLREQLRTGNEDCIQRIEKLRRDYETTVAQLRAQYEDAARRLDAAERDRREALVREQTRGEELDKTRADLKATNAELERTRVELRETKHELDLTRAALKDLEERTGVSYGKPAN